MGINAVRVTSMPPVQGARYTWRDGRYRVWTVGHGLPFDVLPSYGEGGPATVALDGWVASTRVLCKRLSSPAVVAADDGMITASVWRGDFRNPERHPIDGTKYANGRDASRAMYEAGVLGFMVYERDATGYWFACGLPTELAYTIAAEDDAEDAGTLPDTDRRTCHSCRMWATPEHLSSDRHYLATGAWLADLPPHRAANIARKRAFIEQMTTAQAEDVVPADLLSYDALMAAVSPACDRQDEQPG